MNTKFRIIIIFSFILSVVLSTAPIYAFTPATTPTTPTTTTPTTAKKGTLRFIVYYSGDLSTIMNDEDSYMKTFLEVYNLKLISTFEVDEMNGGFTLEAKDVIEFPTEVAREMSLIDNVLMIELAQGETTSES